MSSTYLVRLARAIRDDRIETERAFKALREYPNATPLEDRAIYVMVHFLLDDNYEVSGPAHRRRARIGLSALIREMEEMLALSMP